MEFIIDNECFNKAISDVIKAVSLNTSLPILSGIKIIANNDYLILIGSNSDIFIEKVIPLTIDGVRVLEVTEAEGMVSIIHTLYHVIDCEYTAIICK